MEAKAAIAKARAKAEVEATDAMNGALADVKKIFAAKRLEAVAAAEAKAEKEVSEAAAAAAAEEALARMRTAAQHRESRLRIEVANLQAKLHTLRLVTGADDVDATREQLAAALQRNAVLETSVTDLGLRSEAEASRTNELKVQSRR